MRIEASAAPEFRGHASRANPEELLVASASSCHMLTFLAIAARKRLVVLRYVDDLSVPDVAAALGLTVHAAESLLARARTRLRGEDTRND